MIENPAVKNSLLRPVFLTGVALSSVAMSPAVLDYSLTPRFILLALTVLVCLCLILRANAKKINIDIIDAIFLALALFNIASTAWAHTPSESVFESSKVLLGFFVFVLGRKFIGDDPLTFAMQLARISVIAFYLALGFAIYQLIGLEDLSRNSIYGVTGINGHKNLFSSFLFLNLCFMLPAAYAQEPHWRSVSGVAIALNVILLLILRTKAVFIGASVTLVVLALLALYRRWKKTTLSRASGLIFTWFAIVLLNIFFLYALPRITTAAAAKIKPSAASGIATLDQERVLLWEKTYTVFKKFPVAGTGAGNWQIHFPNAGLHGIWRAEDLNFTFQRPHNDFLWILSESGILGFNIYLLLICMIIVNATINISRGVSFRPLVLLAFMAGFLVVSFFDFPKERIEHTVWFSLLMASVCGARKENAYVRLPAARLIILSAAGITMLILITGSLRYIGELHTKKLYDKKFAGDQAGVMKHGYNAFSHLYTIDPTSVPLHWYTGNALAQLGRFTEAEHDLRIAYRYNPYNRNVLNDLASALTVNKKIDEGKRLYLEASRISPRFDEPKLNLAAIYMSEGNYSDAKKCLDSIFHDSPRRSEYEKTVREVLNSQEK